MPESKGHVPSGWEGSFGPYVLNQIHLFGVVSKDYQKYQSCAGVHEYPKDDPFSQGNPMTLGEFSSISKVFTDQFYPVYLMSYTQRLHSDQALAEKVLIRVKKSLHQGNRSTIGMMVFLPENCSGGACASYQAKLDTWALTKEIENNTSSATWHEVIVTGYDDNAVAVDQEGKKHQGLLTLRNSWGEEVGDHGNYYMSYDYFLKLALEAQVIVNSNKQQ
jgi:C1A family cysteine protease